MLVSLQQGNSTFQTILIVFSSFLRFLPDAVFEQRHADEGQWLKNDFWRQFWNENRYNLQSFRIGQKSSSSL